jgi:glycosyltransferase involved in cell wall biosynthesis
MRDHGLQQAKRFSWEASGQCALDAFESIVSETGSAQSIFLPIDNSLYEELIKTIASIPRDTVQPTDQDLIITAQAIWDNEKTADRAVRRCNLGEKIRWRIEGTFHDNYSLSLLNRETARTLAELGHEVTLWSSDEPGFYLPPQELLLEYLSANPELREMYERASITDHKEVDVVSRNIYPPYVSDMNGRINLLHHYAWEESGFPADWVNEFNDHLHGITCLSTHVEKVLIDHGVNVPLSTSGCGVDHWERVESNANFQLQAKGFRFLHVSSCFPRKGADILLDAYGQLFTDEDDVTLIIKTFKNPHNRIHDWLAERRKNNPDFPHVVIIETELTDAQLKSLYQQCHVMVGPSRGEGFCMPFAEAMLSGLPVITTNWGGQLDFCNDNTAWLVDYKFKQAETHFDLFDSVWAEPDIKDLSNKMLEVYRSTAEERKKRVEMGRRLLLERFRWVNAVERAVQSAREWASMPDEPSPKIGWITTWNTKCGIASYSANLLHNMPVNVSILAAHTDLLIGHDNENVARCWTKDEYIDKKDDLSELTRTIEERGIDTLVIQFNYGFFDFQNLNAFLIKHLNAGRIIIVVFHSTTDPESQPQRKLEKILPALRRCQRLLVHSINDLNQLKSIGLVDNVTIFPHGVMDYTLMMTVGNKQTKLIASYGFFLPHKGLLELIDAFALMRQLGENVKLLMVNAEYPIPISAALIEQARLQLEQLKISEHVDLVTEYLPDQKSLDLISKADLIVFPYQQTGESSSAAVRYGLATGRPVAVTPLSIFDDVSPAVLKLPGFSPTEIAYGISEMLHNFKVNSLQVQQVQESANRWRKSHFYSQLSGRLYGMIQALQRKQVSLSDIPVIGGN